MAEGPIARRVDAIIGRFAADLTAAISELEGGGSSQTALLPPTATPRRLAFLGPNTLSQQAPPVPVPPPGASSAEILESLLKHGLKDRPYDDTFELIAPQPITNTPQDFDAKKYWDTWTVTPTIDALISFKGTPNQNTPTTFAGQAINAGIRASRVWYVAANTGATGQLYMRAARYVDQES
jgi:hypothetical protein